MFVELSNGNMHVLLSEHAGDADYGSSIYFRVRNVEAFVADFLPEVELREMEHGMKEVSLMDPDENRIRIGSDNRVEQ